MLVANTYCIFFVMFARIEKNILHNGFAAVVYKYNTNKRLQGNNKQKMRLP
jgi:hypothetical protein